MGKLKLGKLPDQIHLPWLLPPATAAFLSSLDAPMESSALILIDIQEEFFSSIGIEKIFPNFKANVAHAISAARENGMSVVHVRANYSSDSPWAPWWKTLNPDKLGTVDPNHPEVFVSAASGEQIVKKPTFDAFHMTNLDEVLQGKTHLFFCGLITTCCVLFSTTGAFFRGMNIPRCMDDLFQATRLLYWKIAARIGHWRNTMKYSRYTVITSSNQPIPRRLSTW